MGGWSLSRQVRVQGRSQSWAGFTLNQDNVDMLIHLICMLLGYGRKLKYPEKTYADMGKMCIFHIAVALAENWFFFSINIMYWKNIEWNDVFREL